MQAETVATWVSRAGLVIAALLLTSCVAQEVPPAPPSARLSPTVVPTPAEVPAATPLPVPSRPTMRPTPASTSTTSVPGPTASGCSVAGPASLYVGAVTRGSAAIDLLNLSASCVVAVTPERPGAHVTFGSWLPDGSGFIYLEGWSSAHGYTNANVCIWDLARQARTRCVVSGGDNYVRAMWSPGSTDYIAYERQEPQNGLSYLTIVEAGSARSLYQTSPALTKGGTAESPVAWNPDGRRVLVVSRGVREHSLAVVTLPEGSRQVVSTFDPQKDYVVKALWVQDGQNAVVSVIDPALCCNAEFIPEARDLYWIGGNGTGLTRLIKAASISYYLEDMGHNRLLINTYSSSGPGPMYWLDLHGGRPTRALDDEFQSASQILLGLTPDGQNIVSLDGHYQTWLTNVDTGKHTQLTITALGPIEWRPNP